MWWGHFLPTEGAVLWLGAQLNASPLSASDNVNFLRSLAVPGPRAAGSFHDAPAFFHSRTHTTYHPTSHYRGKTENQHAGSNVCHGQYTEELHAPRWNVIKFLSIYGLGFIAIMTCDVTTLAHETWNKSIKEDTIITKPFLCSAQNIEALSWLWNFSTNSWKEAVLRSFWRCQSTHGGRPRLPTNHYREQPCLQRLYSILRTYQNQPKLRF